MLVGFCLGGFWLCKWFFCGKCIGLLDWFVGFYLFFCGWVRYWYDGKLLFGCVCIEESIFSLG